MKAKPNGTLKIDKGIPPPARKNIGVTATLRELNVNDSFEVSTQSLGGVYSTALRIGIKIVTQKDGDRLRVWRIA